MSQSATLYPCLKNHSAAARPIPRAPPVTTATSSALTTDSGLRFRLARPRLHDRAPHLRHRHLRFIVDQPALVDVLLRQHTRDDARLEWEERALGAHLVRRSGLVRHGEAVDVPLYTSVVLVVRQDVEHGAVGLRAHRLAVGEQ